MFEKVGDIVKTKLLCVRRSLPRGIKISQCSTNISQTTQDSAIVTMQR